MPLTQPELNDLFAVLVTASLQKARVPLTDEKAAQTAISELLFANKISHEREYRLSKRDIVDFWLPDHGGGNAIIEVKMNGARAADVYRQLARYAAFPTVGRVFLVTNKAMGLPKEINGKPAYYMSLGRAWL